MFYSLPTETKLDIFKYLNYQQLCSVKQTNLNLYDFVNKYKGELAREELYCISIDYFKFKKDPRTTLIKPKAENFDFPLNEQFEEEWINELEKPIPLYLPQNSNDIVICLSKVNDYETSYILQLPTIIKSKEDIKIVYYYLSRLFNCYFVYADFDEFIFNPELLQLLFGNAKIPKQFYLMLEAFLTPSKAYNNGKLLKFVVNHLICESIRVNFILKNNAEEYVDLLRKILMNGDKFKNVEFKCRHDMPELFDFVINYIKTSKDCLKMVANIKLDKIGSNFDSLNEKAEEVEEASGRWNKPIYQISNIYNPKIKFSIVYTGYINNGVKFKRIYC